MTETEQIIDTPKITATLYTAVICDTLDTLGYANQSMRPFVRPLDESKVLFGPVRTGLYAPVYHSPADENPYEIEIELIDDLHPGDVVLLACDGPCERLTPWGELLTTAARMRGAVGAVLDGLVRDVRAIREVGFPVFHGGIGPLDSRGRGKMIARDTIVECGGVRVAPGDHVFADVDGVVVIPAQVLAPCLTRAFEKVHSENVTRNAILAGAKLGDVYRKYGVL